MPLVMFFASKPVLRNALSASLLFPHGLIAVRQIAQATGALGNTSCLVGTAEQVAQAILKYYRLGVDSFLIRGFDHFNDTVEFGRELIPRIKAGAGEIDRLQAAG